MKLKTISMIVLSLLMICGTVTAGNAKGRNGQMAVGTVVATDLEVTVQAFEDQAGQKPIANGSTVFDKTAVWVRFTVRNKGFVKADRFVYKAMVYQNGTKTADPMAETITLESNQTKTLPMIKLNISSRTEQISARMIADIGDFVKETNELNNRMELNFCITNSY